MQDDPLVHRVKILQLHFKLPNFGPFLSVYDVDKVLYKYIYIESMLKKTF